MKRTLILGATNNPERYAYLAAQRLTAYGHTIVPVGIKKGAVFGYEILNTQDLQPDVHTITLYVAPPNQTEWYAYILNTQPKRIIFNPGTENPELQQLAEARGIETLEACTLVMLSTGQY